MTDKDRIELIDGRDMALVLTVDHHGMADARSNVDHRQAAEWLRMIADKWDPPTGQEDTNA